MSSAPPYLPSYPKPAAPVATPPPADPMAYIKQKLANGDKLTPSESQAVLNSGLSSTQLTPQVEIKPPVAAHPIGTKRFSTAPTSQTIEAHPVGTPKAGMAPQKPFQSNEFSVTQKAGYGIPPTPGSDTTPAIAATKQPMPIAKAPIPIVAKAAPGPVSAAIAQVSPEAGEALQQPIMASEASKKLDAFQEFLKGNPDGLTLANVLDAVGVSLSAYGGVQRKTALQERRAAEMAQAQAQSLKSQDFEQQRLLKQQDLDNQLALIPAEIEKAKAEASITGDQTRLNLLLEKEAELKNAKALMPLQTAQAIEVERAKTGLGKYQAAGGSAGLINKYSGAN